MSAQARSGVPAGMIRPETRTCLTASDEFAVRRLIEIYGHIVDEGSWAQLTEIVTDDFEYDLTQFGWGVHQGIPSLLDLWRTLRHPVGHHATNIVAWRTESGVHAWSKGISIHADGAARSNVYVDDLRKTPLGWRIARRSARRR